MAHRFSPNSFSEVTPAPALPLSAGMACPLPPDMSGPLLVVGGCRSGKSRLAESWALRLPAPRAYIATCSPGNDADMLARVARHKAERGSDWLSLEAPYDPCTALDLATKQGCHVVLLDCVTLWLSNLMLRHKNDEPIFDEVRKLAQRLSNPPLPMALVSGETGMGVAPATALGHRFRDVQGEANQILAAACPAVVMSVCGLPLVLKSN